MASIKKKNKLYFKVGGVLKHKHKGVKGLHFYTPAQRKYLNMKKEIDMH